MEFLYETLPDFWRYKWDLIRSSSNIRNRCFNEQHCLFSRCFENCVSSIDSIKGNLGITSCNASQKLITPGHWTVHPCRLRCMQKWQKLRLRGKKSKVVVRKWIRLQKKCLLERLRRRNISDDTGRKMTMEMMHIVGEVGSALCLVCWKYLCTGPQCIVMYTRVHWILQKVNVKRSNCMLCFVNGFPVNVSFTIVSQYAVNVSLL